jgi:drug/metabolite transporter (DMT)-like permease
MALMNPKPIVSVLLSAVLFGVSTPLAKLLLGDIRPVALAGLLYLGAFVGLGLYSWAARAFVGRRADALGPREAPLGRGDLPWLAGAVAAGGVIGPVCFMAGLSRISGFSASLLLNFEAAATALIAVLLFKENAGKRVWLALGMMTAAGAALSWSASGGRFSPGGPVLIVIAMAGWGLDNNLTRRISDKDPVQIARIKGLAAGSVSTAAAFILGEGFRPGWTVLGGLAVGALCYGMSLVLFIRALKGLGAFRAGAFFGSAPFVGALASIWLLRDTVRWPMAGAGILMLAGAALIVTETHVHSHRHEPAVHSHSHLHNDPHHAHAHDGPVPEPHTHVHTHEEMEHTHGHWPDTHHRHVHGGTKE